MLGMTGVLNAPLLLIGVVGCQSILYILAADGRYGATFPQHRT